MKPDSGAGRARVSRAGGWGGGVRKNGAGPGLRETEMGLGASEQPPLGIGSFSRFGSGKGKLLSRCPPPRSLSPVSVSERPGLRRAGGGDLRGSALPRRGGRKRKKRAGKGGGKRREKKKKMQKKKKGSGSSEKGPKAFLNQGRDCAAAAPSPRDTSKGGGGREGAAKKMRARADKSAKKKKQNRRCSGRRGSAGPPQPPPWLRQGLPRRPWASGAACGAREGRAGASWPASTSPGCHGASSQMAAPGAAGLLSHVQPPFLGWWARGGRPQVVWGSGRPRGGLFTRL